MSDLNIPLGCFVDVIYTLLWLMKKEEMRQTYGLRKLRVALVPVCMCLEEPGGLDYFGIIEIAADKLNSYGQIVVSKAAGHADGGQAAYISNAAQWISKRKRNVEVGIE